MIESMEENQPIKKITLETLAAMVSAGFSHVDERFDETVTKEDLDAFRQETEERFDKVDARFVHINARLDTIERDVKDIIHREEFEDLMARVKYLEKKLGVESGK